VSSHEYTEWEELDVSSRPELIGVFLHQPALGIVLSALGGARPTSDSILCWANRYRLGERIAPHCDGDGKAQLIICLTAPNSEASGGVLHLNTANGLRACPLAPGDSVLWEATTVKHWTTPLMATADVPEPERLVLVGRYYW
jgi:alkylated DNA repair dioxygenase AlkB